MQKLFKAFKRVEGDGGFKVGDYLVYRIPVSKYLPPNLTMQRHYLEVFAVEKDTYFLQDMVYTIDTFEEKRDWIDVRYKKAGFIKRCLIRRILDAFDEVEARRVKVCD